MKSFPIETCRDPILFLFIMIIIIITFFIPCSPSMGSSALINLVVSLLYRYQTGAFAPLLRWLRHAGGPPVPQAPPRRQENPLPAAQDRANDLLPGNRLPASEATAEKSRPAWPPLLVFNPRRKPWAAMRCFAMICRGESSSRSGRPREGRRASGE